MHYLPRKSYARNRRRACYPTLFDGLQHAWSNSTGVRTIRDLIGTQHGSFAGNADYTPGAKSWTFDGNNDAVECGSMVGFPKMSFSIWGKPDSVASSIFMASMYDSGGTNAYFQFYNSSGGRLKARILQSASPEIRLGRISDSGMIVADVWQHFLMTYDGGNDSTNIKIYLDGVEIGTTDDDQGSWTAPSTTSVTMRLGAQYWSGQLQNEWDGELDDALFWNRVLTPYEAKLLPKLGRGAWRSSKKLFFPQYDATDKGIVRPKRVTPVQSAQQSKHPEYWRDLQLAISTKKPVALDENPRDLSSKRSVSANVNAFTTTIGGRRAFRFDGTAYFSFGDPTHLRLGSHCSLSAWVYAENWIGAGAYPNIIGKTATGSPYGGYLLFPSGDSGDKIGFYCNINGTWTGLYTTMTFNEKQWYHLCATHDGSTMRIYVDGEEENTHSASGSIINRAANVYMGQSYGGDKFDCALDDMMIHSRAFSAAEVRKLYKLGPGAIFERRSQVLTSETVVGGPSTIEAAMTDGLELGDSHTHDMATSESMTDGITLSDAHTEDSIATASMADSLRVGDLASVTVALGAVLSEGVVLSDVPVITGYLADSWADGVVLSDTLSPQASLFVTPTEGIDLGDSLTTGSILPVSVTDGVDLGDSETNTGTLTVSQTEGADLGDSESNTLAAVATVTDGVDLGDSVTGMTMTYAAIVEGVVLSEVFDYLADNLVFMVEGITMGESVDGVGTLMPQLTETIHLGEQPTHDAALLASYDETIVMADRIRYPYDGDLDNEDEMNCGILLGVQV